MRRHRDPIDRFLEKIEIQDAGFETACWLWTAGCDHNGYGRFTAEGRRGGMAHRFSYGFFVAAIPAGLTIDHLCHNEVTACNLGSRCPHRRCVNPDHLAAVSASSNARSGRTGRYNAIKTHCPHGHEYTPENTLIPVKGGRECRACRALRCREWRERRDAA